MSTIGRCGLHWAKRDVSRKCFLTTKPAELSRSLPKGLVGTPLDLESLGKELLEKDPTPGFELYKWEPTRYFYHSALLLGGASAAVWQGTFGCLPL